MVNKRAKGSRNELKVKKMLEEVGYECIKKVHTKHSPGDYFGKYDLICKSCNNWRLIQVKSNRNATPIEREAIQEDKVPSNTTKEIWIMHDRKDPIIHIIE